MTFCKGVADLDSLPKLLQESVWEKPENLFWRKVPTSKLSAEL